VFIPLEVILNITLFLKIYG